MDKWSKRILGLAVALTCLAGCETGRQHESAATGDDQTPVATSLFRFRPESRRPQVGGKADDAVGASSESFAAVLGKGDKTIRVSCAMPKPKYPEVASQLGFEGVAVFRIEMNRIGEVQRLILARSSGYEMLDTAARTALDRLQCHVETNGGPVEQGFIFSKPIRFKLNSGAGVDAEIGDSAQQARAAEQRAYVAEITRLIVTEVVYPATQSKPRLPYAMVRAKISADGTVSAPSIIVSSGLSEYDQAILRGFEASFPWPTPPSWLAGTYIHFRVHLPEKLK